MTTTKTMKGVWVSAKGRELRDFPIPEYGDDEVLIRNVAVASNPKDWKLPVYIAGYENIEGNDVAGYVEAVGANVQNFKKGDKVGAFTKMRAPNGGAYAEFSASPANTVYHLGPNTSFEDGAALALAYGTAVIGLYKRLGLPTPDTPATTEPRPAVLVWGSSSTVGVYVTQLAKLSGLYVVGIAGSGLEHAKSYGLDEAIDYRGKSTEELTAAIKSAAGGRIRHVYDAISEKGTEKAIAYGLQPEGGLVTHVLGYNKELESLPENVKFERTMVATAHAEEGEFAKHWFEKAGEWSEEGKFRAQKVTVIPGGLKGVEEGLRRLQAGEASAEKFVYRISETPGLA